MKGDVGRELAATPLARYLTVRGAGMLMLALSSVAIGLGALAIRTEGGLAVGMVTGLGSAFSLYLSSVWACSRRARVFENGFVPAVLPLSERFKRRTPLIPLGMVSEISNLFSGSLIDGLMFETNNGRKYYVTDTQVGPVAFKEFLNLKHRFYS